MTPSVSNAAGGWPRLTPAEWEDTRDTLHLWTQVVGKIRLALEPMSYNRKLWIPDLTKGATYPPS